jgi:hypothetical protein
MTDNRRLHAAPTLRSWARRILERIPADVRAQLAFDPATAIAAHWPLTVEPATGFHARGAGGWCDGTSITRAGLILYRPTGSRRQYFTLLHELAHHLVEDDDEALGWLADRDDCDRELEQVCDLIAGELLITSDQMDAALAGEPPSAETILRLGAITNGSRSACAIAIGSRLPCDGFVTVHETASDRIFVAARARDTRPYAWRDDLIPAGHPLRSATPPARTATWWPYPNREQRQFFMSAATDGDYTFAVFAENNLWGVPGLHFSDPGRERQHETEILTCPACGHRGPMWLCFTCREGRCPKCGECGCDRAAREQRVMCTGCMLMFKPHLIVDGRCKDCREG